MCQIAIVFLLQRLKGSTSGDVRDFNNMETRAVIKFFYLQGKALKEIHAILTGTLGEQATSHVTVKNWVTQFKRGDFSTCDAPHPGRLKTVTTPEIIDQSHELILEDHRISAKSIAEQLGISREQVGSILNEDLDMQKLPAKWVPKCLSADQKRQRSSQQLLEFFRCDPNDFLSQLVTMDETWLYHYDPETKQQSVEWWHSSSSCPKKFRVQKSTGKVLASIFLDQDVILPTDYLPKGQTINVEYYSSLLVQMKDILKENAVERSPRGSCSCTMPQLTGHLQPRSNWTTWASNVLFTHPILRIWPPVPCTEKKQSKGRHFSSDAEVIAAAETWLDGQPSEFFLITCKSYSNGLRSVLSFVGSMLNKSRVWSL